MGFQQRWGSISRECANIGSAGGADLRKSRFIHYLFCDGPMVFDIGLDFWVNLVVLPGGFFGAAL